MPVAETLGGGVENPSFQDLADPTAVPVGHAAMNRPGPRLPDLPPPNRGNSKSAAEAEGDKHPDSDAPVKIAAGRVSASVRGAGKIPAANAVQPTIDAIDPYDPAAFNNQANAPTVLATPAAAGSARERKVGWRFSPRRGAR